MVGAVKGRGQALRLSLPEARRILLCAQGLDNGWELPSGREGAAQVVERLGYVQIDTIAVIERAHHHVLWTRGLTYQPVMLEELLSQERRVFEYWAHAAAYIPMRDYRYYLPKMRIFAQRHRQWLKENRGVVRQVLERIRAEGPLSSADFEDTRAKRGTWWDWKPAKRALELLFSTGQLMISGRRHFQRRYDLTERVLPPGLDVSELRPEESACFVARRALHSQGLAAEKQTDPWLSKPRQVSRAFAELIEAGEAVPVRVEGLEKRAWYAWRSPLEARPPRRKAVHLLSPFDNLIIDRRRTEQFFNFEYRIECYTPAPRRKYGYFTLPILWGEELVGRLDPKADRQQQVFYVKNLVFEPGFKARAALLPALAEKLRAFAAFHGCGEIVVEKTTPAAARAELRRAVAALDQ